MPHENLDDLNRKDSLDDTAHSLENYGAKIAKEERVVGAYRASFHSENALTTVRFLLEDYSGADVVITNMTTLPEEMTDQGLGGKAIQSFLKWAEDSNLNVVLATQIRTGNEGFWIKNNFKKVEGENPTNDFIYEKKG